MSEDQEDEYAHSDSNLMYTPVSIPGRGCPETFNESPDISCRCATSDSCQTQSCKCFSGLRIECSQRCNCNPASCTNRVVQRGPAKQLYTKEVDNKGLGLYCGRDLGAGTFVTTYAGEILSSEEGILRNKTDTSRNYILFVSETFHKVLLRRLSHD